jgi:N-acylneuraminate cytidylyltransferase
MNNIAIIPARGGSKRIPKKNSKHFFGLPIIAYSIKAALESKLFKEVLVSTDDLEIAKIAESFGASVPFIRSSENASDFATTIDVIEEVVKELKNKNNFYENICCIYPCAPFISTEKLTEAYNLMIKNEFDSVFPVVPFTSKIQRAFKLLNEKIEMFYPEFELSRSQDLESTFYDSGQFYWIRTEKFINNRKLFTKNSGAIILDELKAHDIDTEIDWQIAEIKYSHLKKIENV